MGGYLAVRPDLPPWPFLCNAFGLLKDKAPAPLNNRQTVFKVAYPSGKAVLKVHWFVSEERFPPLEELTALLECETIIPPHRTSADGNRLVQHNNQFFSVSNFIKSSSSKSDWDIKRLTQSLAKMHGVLKTIATPVPINPMAVPLTQLVDELIKMGRISFARVVEDAHHAARHLPRQIVHNDLHPENCLQNEQKTYFIDLDSYDYGFRIVDALFAALRFTNGEHDREKEFISEYNRSAGLTVAEKTHGPTLLTASLIGKLAFIHREAKRGNPQYLNDTDKYEELIKRAMQLERKLIGL